MKVSDKDLQQWKKWNKSKSPSDLSNLLNQVNPLIRNAVTQNAGTLPYSILEAEAKIQAVNAFNTFNPKKKVKLSTHLTNYFKKLNRLNYQYQEIYKVPEARRIKYHTYNVAKSHLKDELDRDPTSEELAGKLGWSNAEINRFNKEDISELSESQPYSSDVLLNKNTDYSMLSYIYNDLSPQNKLLLEHTTGYGGKPVLNNTQLMNKLNMTQGQLSYSKKKLTDEIKRMMGRYV